MVAPLGIGWGFCFILMVLAVELFCLIWYNFNVANKAMMFGGL